MSASGEPILELRLEPAFDMQVSFGAETQVALGPLAQRRAFLPVIGGTVAGSRLSGEIVAGSGGDWPRIENGSAIVEGQWLIRARDGTHILMKSTGYLNAAVATPTWRGESAEFAAPSLHLAPIFEAPDGPHAWLTWTIFVGKGDRLRNGARCKFFTVM